MNKVGIVGGGSIGLLLAAYLSELRFDVKIYTRTKEQARKLNNEGLTLTKESLVLTYRVKAIPFSKVERFNDEIIFVAVKQYHLKELFPSFLKLSGKMKSVVFLQNGMAHVKLLEKLIPKVENIFIGIVEHGALKRSSNEVSHTGDGELKIGCYQKQTELYSHLWDALTTVGFSTSIHDNWLEIMEKKLVVNGVINPLTAILKVRNGSLIINSYYFQMMRMLFDEISTIISCNEKDWQDIIKICENTARNQSSMLKDIVEGRQTEVDAITGLILERALEKGVSLPYNLFVYNSLKGMELQRGEERYE